MKTNYNLFYKLAVGFKNVLFKWFANGVKFKIFVLLIILSLYCSYTQGGEKKVIPEELRPILKEVGRKDPFLPPNKKEGQPQLIEMKNLQLQGILWDENKPLAIINDKVVGEGQKIGDKKIIKIEKDSVIMEAQDGERYTIKLHQKGGSE